MECKICCHVYGAEQGTDRDQNRDQKEMSESLLANVVTTKTIADPGGWGLLVAVPGPLLFHLLHLPDLRKDSQNDLDHLEEDNDLQPEVDYFQLRVLDLHNPMKREARLRQVLNRLPE